MRWLVGSLGLLVWVVLGVACTTVDPSQCWINTSGGFGGGGTIPIGAAVGASSGDFAAAPPSGPLNDDDVPNPCIEKQSPCHEKCDAHYVAAAIQCGKIQSEAERKTCQDAAYAAYKICRVNCDQSINDDCMEKYQNCLDHGPTSCLKEEAGKKVCYRCWERCVAGDPPSSRCKKCLF